VKVARRASSVALAAAEESKVSRVAEGGVIIVEVSRIPRDDNKMNARSTWKDIMPVT